MPERTIEEWVGGGRLHRVHREVFAVGHPRITEAGRRWAAILAYGKTALLSHGSAAALWGLARQRSRFIDITAPTGRQGARRREGIFIHRGRLHREDRAVRTGIPVTTVARTLFDLAEFVSFKRLESAWEEADRLNLLQLRVVRERLRARLRSPRTSTNSAPARRVTRTSDHPLAATAACTTKLPPSQASFERSYGRMLRRPDQVRSMPQEPRSTSTAILAVSVGLSPTRTPFASSASFFACAVPEEPEMIAPAWPICLPGGAVKPAM